MAEAGTGDGLRRIAASGWTHLVLAMVIIFGLRLPYCSQVVINWDESIYLVAGQEMARGGAMYVGAWDHKGPLLLGLFWIIVELAGTSICAVRLLTTAFLLASMLGVHLIARRLAAGPFAVTAALYYGLFFCDRRFGGLASNGELLMMLPAIFALGCALAYVRPEAADGQRGRLGWLVGCGGLCSTAGLIKASAADTAVVGILLVLGWHLQTRDNDWRMLLRELGALATGGLAVVAAVLAGFAIRGTAGTMIDAYLVFNREYVATFSIADAWAQWGSFLHWAMLRDHLSIIAAGALLVVLASWRVLAGERWRPVLALTLVVLSFLGVVMGRNLFFHYYLQMALPYALLVALALSTLEVRRSDAVRLLVVPMVLLIAVVLAPSRVREQRRVALADDDPAVTQVAEFVSAHSEPDDSIFVFGGQPVIYYLADRPAPTRYFFWVHQVDRYATLLGSVEVVARDLRDHPPLWFIHHPSGPLPPEYERLLQERYRVATSIGEYVLWQRVGG